MCIPSSLLQELAWQVHSPENVIHNKLYIKYERIPRNPRLRKKTAKKLLFLKAIAYPMRLFGISRDRKRLLKTVPQPEQRTDSKNNASARQLAV